MIHTHEIFTCCFAAAALLGVPSLAHANTSPSPSTTPLTFEWLRGRGAESCPDADQVASEIEAKAGRTVFSAGAPHKIEVLITRTGDVWTARIEERDATGVVRARSPIPNEGDDCTTIKDASVLNVLLLLEDASAGVPMGPSSEACQCAPSTPTTKSASPEPAKPASEVRPPASPSVEGGLKITVMARASIRYGLVPGVAPDIGMFGSVGKKWWEASVGLSWMPQSPTDDGNFAFGLATAWLGGCLHVPLRTSRLALSGCGHMLVGALHNSVLGLDTFRPVGVGELAWVGAAISPRLRIFPVRRFVVEVGGDLTVPITRYRSTDVGGANLLFEQTRVAVSGFFGVGMSIP